MIELYRAARERAESWFERLGREGWLGDAGRAALARVDRRTPEDLFADLQMRPLVVALFGGTGVGKSSLLNRLAGQEVAKTGEERPTSREVTLYLHASIELAKLPPELPIESIRVKRHAADSRRQVAWIDAPDIDSTEQENRRRALAWLPHVDLVCYVVSPERYRDDAGWRVLLERGHAHGWMFVMNRWDEGDPRQVEDFARILTEAGFDAPLILRTSCLAGAAVPTPDEFLRIQQTLDELVAAHGVRELARLGQRARLQELREAVRVAARTLGDEGAWAKLTEEAERSWDRAAETVREGMEWTIRSISERFAVQRPDWWQRAGRVAGAAVGGRAAEDSISAGRSSGPSADSDRAQEAGDVDELLRRLWDDWADGKLAAWADGVELATRRAGVAAEPIRRAVDEPVSSAGGRVVGFADDYLRAELARPGSALARLLRRGTGFAMVFLPAMALLWVAYDVVRGYWVATRGQGAFLGTEFLINAGLMVLVSWLLPYVADRALRPSLERVALRALRAGLAAGLDEVRESWRGALRAAAERGDALRAEAREMETSFAALVVRPVDVRAGALARMLARPGAAGRQAASS